MGFRSDRRDEDDKEKKPDYQALLANLLQQATELIPKLNMEYNKYFSGAEKKPPIKLREQLDKLIDNIKSNKKHAATPALGFKTQNAINSYVSYKTNWDKRMAEIESGRR